MTATAIPAAAPIAVYVDEGVLAHGDRADYGIYKIHAVIPGEELTACMRFNLSDVKLYSTDDVPGAVDCRACSKRLASVAAKAAKGR